MQNHRPLNVLPVAIQSNWMATLQRQVSPQAQGHFYLVNIRPTKPKSFEEQRVVVLVVDENGFPLPNVRVAFSYSTADQFTLSPDFLWSPPPPHRAFIVPTAGSGQIDQIQGSQVRAGEPGGITVYLLEPEYSSDVVAGAGTLADHTGLHLTYQLRRTGVMPLLERLAAIETRLTALEAG
ncbi:MAG: hypothetical protein KJ077_10465 [Anaerolineae bacterium]|nr:hypothetical protein [Anaerolineae bacterium]